MQRRHFLYQSGLVLPVVLLSPAMLYAGTIIDSNLIIIKREERLSPLLSSGLQQEEKVMTLMVDELKELLYADGKFQLVTHTGNRHQSQKIIFDLPYQVDTHNNRIIIEEDQNKIELNYDLRLNKGEMHPEFWSFGQEFLHRDQILYFMKRDKPAFLCLS